MMLKDVARGVLIVQYAKVLLYFCCSAKEVVPIAGLVSEINWRS